MSTFRAPILLFELSVDVALSQSLGNAYGLVVVENPEFAIGLCHSSRDISIFGFRGHFRLFVIIGIAQGHSLRARRGRLPLEF